MPHFRRVAIMLDGDEASRREVIEIAARLANRVWIRIVDTPDGKEPDQLSTTEIQKPLAKV